MGHKNLQLDPNFAAFAPAVKPVVDAGFADGPIALTGDSSFHQITGMSLPKGKWVVVVKAYLNDSTATGFHLVRCQVGNGTKNDSVELQLPSTGTIDTIQPLVLTWFGSLAARATVALTCRTTGSDVNVDWVKMIAYKAGTLQTTRLH